ncbi:uncharacterized protein LOC129572780 [Sitodiplosis mosellana]|uniref:uncharacterized protein LOC129572780 n=1 Tax=Sitodiplosis mosellana TaxID=263140 RepID=UPI0024444EB5|nr:uncharacterized protein LOC129572780 [Sitodiplosis mosellana]
MERTFYFGVLVLLCLISCISSASISSTGTGSVVAMDLDVRPVNEDPLVSSIKVSSAAIQIIRPKSQANTPLAKRHLLLPHNSKPISNPSAAQVIVTKYFEA